LAEKFSSWPNPVSTFPGVAYAYVQDYKSYRPDMYNSADSLEELARKIGVNEKALVDTAETFQKYTARGEDPEFGRTKFGDGLTKGPYYALGPLQAYITLADGGLMVDSELRVIDETGEPVEGLWAAGSTGQ